MAHVLDEIKRYAPRLYPVRGVCVDQDDPYRPSDGGIDVSKIKPGSLAEIDAPDGPINIAASSPVGKRGYDRQRSLFEYFLDGTRRTFLVAEMETSSRRYLPILGGQVSAAVMHRDRDTGRVKVFRHAFANVVAMPGGGLGINEDDLRELQERLASAARPFEVLTYGEKGLKQGKDPIEYAIAKVNAAMQSLEVRALEQLTNENLTESSRLLLVDGSVQFTSIDHKNLSWLRNVVGLSKSFSTRLTFTRDKKEIGALLVESLRAVGDRTPAFRYEFQGRPYAAWYLRIRERATVDKPLSGIVKLERVLLTDEEVEIGLPSDIVDNVSLSVLGERYPTPYGQDDRWANHLYPVFLAEQYQKQKLMSERQFLHLF